MCKNCIKSSDPPQRGRQVYDFCAYVANVSCFYLVLAWITTTDFTENDSVVAIESSTTFDPSFSMKTTQFWHGVQ